MRERTCCFTGHRELPPEKMTTLITLYNAIESLIDLGVDRFACGGAWALTL